MSFCHSLVFPRVIYLHCYLPTPHVIYICVILRLYLQQCPRWLQPTGQVKGCVVAQGWQSNKAPSSEEWASPSPHSSHYSKSPSLSFLRLHSLWPPLASTDLEKISGESKPPRAALAFARPANSRNIEPITRLLSGGSGRGTLWESSYACQCSLLDEEKVNQKGCRGGGQHSCSLAYMSLQVASFYRHWLWSKPPFLFKRFRITPGNGPFRADHVGCFTPPSFICQVVISCVRPIYSK